MKRLWATGIAVLLAHGVPAYAAVDSLDVGGPDLKPGDVVGNITDLLTGSIVAVGIAMFLVGALLYTISGEKEDRKNQGKDFMIGALIGVGIVVSARAILNLVLYFIYGG
ncbi:MAG: hypothetical protein PHO92_01725 [Candidatus Peribacteraceae bacterium]|nr:hypothetical protein [Candidatus Peribacteraceae bacterium]